MSFSRILGLGVVCLALTVAISIRSIQTGDLFSAYLAMLISTTCAFLCSYLHIKLAKQATTKDQRFQLKVRRLKS